VQQGGRPPPFQISVGKDKCGLLRLGRSSILYVNPTICYLSVVKETLATHENRRHHSNFHTSR